MMLMPIRTFVVFAASQGMSGMPWSHSPLADTGKAFGNCSIMPNEFWSSSRSDASGTTIRSSAQTESKSRSSARLVRSSSSLTVTLLRKFGKYRASFMRDIPFSFVVVQSANDGRQAPRFSAHMFRVTSRTVNNHALRAINGFSTFQQLLR